MRTFKCFDCGHTWQLPFGQGGMGSGLSCSQCGSRNVHRAPEDRGWRRWSEDQPETKIVGDEFPSGRGYGPGRRGGHGRRRRGNWSG